MTLSENKKKDKRDDKLVKIMEVECLGKNVELEKTYSWYHHKHLVLHSHI